MTDVKTLQTKGCTAEELEGKLVYISDNEGIDLAFIDTSGIEQLLIFIEEGKIMQIVAYGYEYLAKIEIMIITAKVRGGNSGSQVVNENGCLVGVACQLPSCEQDNGYYMKTPKAEPEVVHLKNLDKEWQKLRFLVELNGCKQTENVDMETLW